MASLNLYTFKIAPGGMEIPALTGDYVRIEKADVPLWVRTENGDNFLLDEGEEAQIQAFTRLNLSHEDAAEQTVRIFVGNGARVGSAKVSGEVSVPAGVNVNNIELLAGVSVMGNQIREVGNVESLIVGTNSKRAMLIIQNRHSFASISMSFGAPNGFAISGLRLGPGERVDFVGGIVPRGHIRAIGDAVLNSEVVVIEGSYS